LVPHRTFARLVVAVGVVAVEAHALRPWSEEAFDLVALTVRLG
jgi:hypothetical protein